MDRRAEKRSPEEQIAELEEEVARLRRLAVVGQQAAVIVHALRNRSGIMSNAAHYLASKLKDADPKVVRNITLIRTELGRSEGMYNSLLAFARKEPLKTRPVQVSHLLTEVVERIRDSTNTQFISRYAEVPSIQAEPYLLEEVFVNLINNAVEAMGREGELLITTQRKDDWVSISFQDTGPGITPEMQDRIFDFMFTTKEGGTGAGLWFCREVVEAHGGRIELKSEVGVGSAFTVLLPLEA